MHGSVGPGHYVTLGPTIRIHASAILWASPEQKFIRNFCRCWSTYETKFTPHIVPHMSILVKLFNFDICQQVIMASTRSLPTWYRQYFTREKTRDQTDRSRLAINHLTASTRVVRPDQIVYALTYSGRIVIHMWHEIAKWKISCPN
jgi:hypothetical protein